MMGGVCSTSSKLDPPLPSNPQDAPGTPSPVTPTRSRKSSTTPSHDSSSVRSFPEEDDLVAGPPSPDSSTDISLLGDQVKKDIEEDDNIDPNIEGFHVGHADDFEKNGMVAVKINEKCTVVVGKYQGRYYGFGSKCPHRGAPLAGGHLQDGIVKCPWHGASFDITTGEIEDYPGSQCIPTYKVRKDVHGALTVYPTNFGVYKVEKPLQCEKVKTGKRAFVILGTGAAGFICAQTLRENHYKGEIIMVSKDKDLPYDRTKLSKGFPAGWEEIKLKDPEWFKRAQINVILDAEVCNLDLEKRKVIIRGRTPLYYTKLLIATGCRSTIPPSDESGVRGTNLKNVLTMYSLKDAMRIQRKCQGKNVVIQGSGFIAMEMLTPLSKLCKKLTVVCRSKYPYMSIFGEVFGSLMLNLIKIKYPEVTFLTCEGMQEILGNEEGQVSSVVTTRCKDIPCDIVICAIGGTPNTEFINKPVPSPEDESGDASAGDSPLKMNITERGFIPVTEFMETSIKDVYAAGDVAQIPLKCSVKENTNVPHWCMAQKMGKIAALKAIADIRQIEGEKSESIYNTVPFLYTSAGGVNVRFVGSVAGWTKNYVFGDSNKFCIIYKHENRIISCLTANCDPLCAKISFNIQNQEVFINDTLPTYIKSVFNETPRIGSATDKISK